MYESGDIILTRNTDEVGNDTPGYWNHAAISAGHYIIEAQAEPNQVIAVKIDTFRLRYPEFLVLRYKSPHTAYQAALYARDLIGKPYRKLASIFMFWRRSTLGENCVSVVRKAWAHALGFDPKWRRPDHIAGTDLGFTEIEHYSDYVNWRPPTDAGRII